MSEGNGQVWGHVKPALSGWDAVRIEGAAKGTPDVNHKHGWIELKWLSQWPKRADTLVKFPKYKQEQKVWHRRRSMAGGLVHVLVNVEKDWLLFEGGWAALHLGQLDRVDLCHMATGYWKSTKEMKNGIKEAILSDIR